MGVFQHQKDVYKKLIALINYDEIHNEQVDPTPAGTIIQDIKKVDDKEWEYNDYARDWYWRITRHHLEDS